VEGIGIKQKYKVFINDQPVVFTDKTGSRNDKYKYTSSFDDLPAKTADLKPGETLCVECNDTADTWIRFTLSHEILEAAGGIVWHSEKGNKMLMIFRLGKWDLPKGKIDKGESPEKAALREVEEECGISGMKILHRIDDTWHMYKHKGSWKLKHSYWFEMSYSGTEKLVPQLDESIEEARWVTPSEMAWLLQDAYASIRELIEKTVKI
jgi:8-oxo-dGTP pyrophosphatase MutT (NUDIX family)